MLGSLLQTGLGVGQTVAGLLKKKPKRPTYQIPSEVKEQVSRGRIQANASTDPLVENARENIRQNMADSVATASRGSRQGSAVLNSLGAAQMNANRATAGLADYALNIKMQREQQYNQALDKMAQERAKAFQINQMDAYIEKRDERNNLIGAGLQNTVAGANGLGASAAMAGEGGEKKGLGGDISKIFTLGMF